ncbi:PaeR7I family type II restriction endonuclease [Sinosporangium siamense]|uniref:Type-2 restriction enzyme n=1 Tax=Sinosporangium siamense TaxID=1367973 RepID=A0A919V7L0_9ACTN|nr:PaeR7I family type II restriction endonuclease [Sinosporangium siamense]GII93211.1 type-2 restriction enzyme [Sinosporangium siamense]
MRQHPAQHAVNMFWELRERAAKKQSDAGRSDAGFRSAVTAGQHMRELEEVVIQEFVESGIPRDCIRQKTGVELPGYYRAAKKWDIVVVHRGSLIAAIEFKSQVGPSFGNNVNNRIEEAIGSATDVWRAYEEGTFGSLRPWLGYFFILEATPKSMTPISVPTTVSPVEKVFINTSYMDRYRILCQRLVRERLYDAACFITTTPGSSEATAVLNEPDPELGFANFAAAIAGRVVYTLGLPDTGIGGKQEIIL